MTGTDRRTETRRKVDLLINRYVDGQPYMCRVVDISRSGMGLVPLLEPAAAPRYVGLEFELPGGARVITASAETVRADDGRAVAVRFTRLAPEHAALIDQYTARAA